MVFLNLQIQQIADGLTAMGWNPSALPANALVAYSTTAPSLPTSGQLWLNSATSVLQIYSAGAWQAVSLTAAQSNMLVDMVTNGYYNKLQADNLLGQKQDTLLAGTNIKTVNGQSLVGSGNLTVTAAMGNLDSLSDVVVTLPSVGQTVSYDGVNWVNTTPITSHTGLSNIGTNTHAQIDTALTRLANTSGTNTGDETVTTIKAALGITTLSGSNTGDQDLSGYSLTTHNHTGVYEPVIAVKNTGFNLNTGTTAGTLALGDHNHTGTYEPADATILKSASIGVSVQGYDATTLKSSHIGVTVEAYDVNIGKVYSNQTWFAAQRGSISTITYGATITPDFAIANNFVCTLTGNVVVANPTNIVAGQYGKITLIQDATGTRTVGYGTYFKFAGGTAPTLVTTANSKTSYYYEVASSTEIVIAAVSDWK